jgi:hypothetical protein
MSRPSPTKKIDNSFRSNGHKGKHDMVGSQEERASRILPAQELATHHYRSPMPSGRLPKIECSCGLLPSILYYLSARLTQVIAKIKQFRIGDD